jgi:hypothetical protein
MGKKNDHITWTELLNPNKEIECLLKELFSAYKTDCCGELELKVEGQDIVFGFCGEYKKLPLKAICDYCSTCIQVSSACIEGQLAITYTLATMPVVGFPGQTIFVTDMVAADLTTGNLAYWQPSSSSWKRA